MSQPQATMRHHSRRKRPRWPEKPLSADLDNGTEDLRNFIKACKGVLGFVEEVVRSRMAPEPPHLVAGKALSRRSKAAAAATTFCSTATIFRRRRATSPPGLRRGRRDEANPARTTVIGFQDRRQSPVKASESPASTILSTASPCRSSTAPPPPGSDG